MQELEKINGIGPAIAAKMAQFGIASVEELVAMRPNFAPQFADRVEGLSLRQLTQDFRPQARFMVLPGVTPEMASVLVASGYRTYRQVIFAEAAEIRQNLQHAPAGLASDGEIILLQLACARAQSYDRAIVQVTDAEDGKPITNSTLTLRDASLLAWSTADTREGDAQGTIFSPALARGRQHRMFVDAPGYRRTSLVMAAQGGLYHKVRIGLTKGVTQPDADEFLGQSLGIIPEGAFVTVSAIAAADVPAGSMWRLRSQTQAGLSTMECLMRRRYGSEIRVYSTKVTTTALPAGATPGNTFIVGADGSWAAASTIALAALTARRTNSGRRIV